jgi:hypothetical protein
VAPLWLKEADGIAVEDEAQFGASVGESVPVLYFAANGAEGTGAV